MTLPSFSLLVRRTAGLACASAVVLLAACGGGGGGDDPTPRSSFAPSSGSANVCTADSQKQFVRSYLDEIYLWYDEIVNVDPANYASVQDYYRALLVRTPDSTGQPKDRFSSVLTSAGADAIQASDLTKAPAEPQPVEGTKVVTSATGKKVGYIRFNNHNRGAQDQLIAAVANLRPQGIQELVLDMRYNAGGFLYVAQTAASLVAGPQANGRVFEQLRYNDKRQAESAASTFFFSNTVQTAETQYARGTALPQLSLPKLYVLTSGDTCSASESIINSLRGIDIDVVLVGDTTCGKPYGFRRKDNCGLAFFPIEFQGSNAKGFGDYAAGFTPQCRVADDPETPLGEPSDPLLAGALTHIDTGACPAGTATNAPSKASLLSQDLGTGRPAASGTGRPARVTVPGFNGRELLQALPGAR